METLILVKRGVLSAPAVGLGELVFDGMSQVPSVGALSPGPWTRRGPTWWGLSARLLMGWWGCGGEGAEIF